ncbi:MAG TPA: carboxypeptidase-like regulatory domain-containing protein [Bryobacteraceae bacterium]
MLKLTGSLLGLTVLAFAQSDRGTITGTITDPAGAVVANASIEVRNIQTGAAYQVGSSSTGNYVVQVPTGAYQISVTVMGFKKYVRQNIEVPVEQTLRIDAILEVGSSAESVTVTEAAPLLKTESGELSHNVTSDTLNSLPILGIGQSAVGSTGIRSVYSVTTMLPGNSWLPDNSLRINGLAGNSEAVRVEGQDATATGAAGPSGTGMSTSSTNEPSVEAVQEVAVQTSNYAAEFGQAGGGVFNFTMKSGSNQFHGSGYDYFVNEALNAGTPFTNDGTGHLLRPRQRRNDYGFSVGGPVLIPRVYNGHDKTFFFINWEQFREKDIINNLPLTMPIPAYRQGNFQQALTGRNLGTDGLGRPIMENQIFDPSTTRLINGVSYRDPFPNNTIPVTELDPVALKAQAYLPLPNLPGLVSNYLPVYTNSRVSTIPSVKLDHSISTRLKLSGYWGLTRTDSPNNMGLPYPIQNTVPTHIKNDTTRGNIDYTITPTLLLHVGIGYLLTSNNPEVPPFNNSQQLGFNGVTANIFPYFSVLNENTGGSEVLGPPTDLYIRDYKPSATASITWVHNNHTYKVGGESVINGYPMFTQTYAPGNMLFNPSETADPSLNGRSLAATEGFDYASFLLGLPNTGYIAAPTPEKFGDKSFAWYVQDSWKALRTLTIDYGLRYDFQTYIQERNGLMQNISISTPNPAAGGLPGGTIFEGYGPGRCNCHFAHNYPYAFQPRLGIAYQINSKTVLRAGAGISYAKTQNYPGSNFGSNKPFGPPSYGVAPFTLAGGVPYHIKFPNFDPGQTPLQNNGIDVISNPVSFIDPNAGRPARIIQWTFGLQRQIGKDLMVEGAYIGNMGVWWSANTLSPWAFNPVPYQTLAAAGLNINNPADQQLLTSFVNSPLAISRGFGNPPFPEFPLGLTVAQTLRGLPEYTGLVQYFNPLGNSWYDAVQAKATKRLSHGLDALVTYTWSKNLLLGAEDNNQYSSPVPPIINDVYNRQNNKSLSGLDQPQILTVAANYTTPKVLAGRSDFASKLASWIARDWTYGAVLRYASGFPFAVPAATTNLGSLVFQTTRVDRVPGVPLFTEDLNCHCFDPTKVFVLNPAAWVNPPNGQFGTANAHYGDYREQRHPVESMSLGRNIRIKERANLLIRAEFTNIFNRTGLNVPTSTNAFATQTTNAAGQTTGGFGWINTAAVGGNNTAPAAAVAGQFATPLPRQGTLVARFRF